MGNATADVVTASTLWRDTRDTDTPTAGKWEYVITEERTVQRSWETASNYTTYRLLPGTYPVELVNINYTPWNPNPAVRTPGYVANIGPYYAVIKVDAIEVGSYWENRVFSETSAHTSETNKPCTYSIVLYDFQVTEGGNFRRIG